MSTHNTLRILSLELCSFCSITYNHITFPKHFLSVQTKFPHDSALILLQLKVFHFSVTPLHFKQSHLDLTTGRRTPIEKGEQTESPAHYQTEL